MDVKDIAYGTPVYDKSDKLLGKVANIIEDAWSGEPRKFVVRPDEGISAVYFRPEHVAEATAKKVKLNLAAPDLEQT
jgi:hypothetical protein